MQYTEKASKQSATIILTRLQTLWRRARANTARDFKELSRIGSSSPAPTPKIMREGRWHSAIGVFAFALLIALHRAD